ncbi:nucleotide exchange factor GrpE [Candidatus Wolfebacteria bacterium]|nr:nucleotide exchange factor GrpE [Candidatus Wolfebacteria bacterium]
MTEENKKEKEEENNQIEEEKKETLNECEECQKQRDEYLDGWKRAKADLINYKKDEAQRLESVVKFANEVIINSLINVLDSFDLAMVSLEKEDDEKTQKGLYLIRQQLEDIMKQNGLEKIVVSVGKQFDPAFQEAIAEVKSDNPSGAVVEEVKKGYILSGKVIRPARVKVAK